MSLISTKVGPTALRSPGIGWALRAVCSMLPSARERQEPVWESLGARRGEDKSRALQGQEQSHPVRDTCFGSSDAQAHLPRDDGVLVNPGFEVFILLLENLDLFLQDNVLLCL